MNRKIKVLYISFLQFKKNFIQYPYRKFNFIELFLIWLSQKLTRSQFLVLSGILVGLSAGSAGVILKVFVHYIQSSISTATGKAANIWCTTYDWCHLNRLRGKVFL